MPLDSVWQPLDSVWQPLDSVWQLLDSTDSLCIAVPPGHELRVSTAGWTGCTVRRVDGPADRGPAEFEKMQTGPHVAATVCLGVSCPAGGPAGSVRAVALAAVEPHFLSMPHSCLPVLAGLSCVMLGYLWLGRGPHRRLVGARLGSAGEAGTPTGSTLAQ